MAPISTYVFIDLETTGLPREEGNKTKITELCMIAVKREHILECRAGAAPRVQAKFTHCFNPRRMIMPGCSEVTGLCNDLLEFVAPLDKKAHTAIQAFLDLQSKPICLLAHNGFSFDFPILRRELDYIKAPLSDDIMCADTYFAFYDIEQKKNNLDQVIMARKIENPETTLPETSLANDELMTATDTLHMQQINNTTPSQSGRKANTPPKRPIKHKDINKVRRRFPWSSGERPKVSYKMKQIYERLLNRPGLDAHRAEADCIMTMECAVAVSEDFVQWIDENHSKFSDVTPMTVGVRIDL